MSGLGNLIPLGKKEDKSKKSEDLTSGLIPIGGKAPKDDDNVDDFDLDDLLSDTPKKKADDSPGKSSKKKSSKSKSKSSPKSKSDKKSKKKDKSSMDWDASGDLGASDDAFASPPKPSSSSRKPLSFENDDDVIAQLAKGPAKKKSMQNLDDEFARALGFDESEFLSATSPTNDADTEDQPPPPSAPPPAPEPSSAPAPDDRFSLASSFFQDDAGDEKPKEDSFSSDRRGRGRRSSTAMMDDDPFAKKPSKIESLDIFGSSRRRSDGTDAPTKPSSTTPPKATQVTPPKAATADVTPPKTSAPDSDLPAFPWMKKKTGAEPTPTPKETPPVSETRADTAEATPSFPWMRAKADAPKPTDEAVVDDPPAARRRSTKAPKDADDVDPFGTDETPSFPWMKKKTEGTPDVTKADTSSSDMPSFPWSKPKVDEPPPPSAKSKTPPKAIETKTTDDDELPEFPWLKKSNPKENVPALQEAKEPPKTVPLATPSPEKPVAAPSPEKLEEPPTRPRPRVDTAPPSEPEPFRVPDEPVINPSVVLEPTPAEPPPASSPARSPSIPMATEAPPRAPSPVSPRRTSIEAPPSPTHRGSGSGFDKSASSPPKAATGSPTRAPGYGGDDGGGPQRLSPASRGTFLDNTMIVPAFISHQLEASQALVASLEAQVQAHSADKTALQSVHDQVLSSLSHETARAAGFESDLAASMAACAAATSEASTLRAGNATLTTQVGALTQEKQALSTELTMLRVQASSTADLQAQIAQLLQDKSILQAELQNVSSKLVLAQRDLSSEQALHAQSVERFKRLEHDRAQEALQQQRWRDEENRHAEKEAVERLLTQVRAAVSNLKVLQENVVFGKSEADVRSMGENESRSRLLLEMEGSCKAYMSRTQEECQRLQSLLSALETTMRSLRGEHMEEKERLRSEQARLEELALHFKSQTTLLQERTDTNTKVVSQTLASYIQDIRIAEARMHKRREQHQEEERSLHMARAAFAAQQEEALRDQRIVQDRHQAEAQRLNEKLGRLRAEKHAFEDMIARYATEMETLAEMQRHLDNEKDSLRHAAQCVEAMAEKVKAASEVSAANEQRALEERDQAQAMLEAMHDERLRLQKHWSQVDERERRLQEEIKYMDATRRKLTEERSSLLTHRRHARSATDWSRPPAPIAAVSYAREYEASTPRSNQTPPTPTPAMWRPEAMPQHKDPTGLSPSFRTEMEGFWSKGSGMDPATSRQTAQLKDRMFLSCVGLDHSKYTPPRAGVPMSTYGRTPSPSLGSFAL
ncbi:hypothetical protein SDRG_14643 [Saprolegnia diclina VS20]|uniref:Uncharacterized protein n=1 Tax=Saprolegnia diclina (strain VS20) TaxID=1156394 RepID=T0PQ39_SAPDV|nr:hypothetical protein SDRG_14643 [Saprolegnia diclina VS20]EQC27589.1 hypothetical protein SDRG_14643 [Saprolegnia diclina VS20]|eukprot:XP_008619009.1 hypothetical protein SDRG_14643 [Saprolegnia diclina VS20]